MAFTADLSTMPNTSQLDTGSSGASVTAGMLAAARTLNGLHATAVPALPGQRFFVSSGSSVISLTGAASEPAWSARIPVVTDAHDIKVRMRARAPSGSGDLVVSTSSDNASVTVSGSTEAEHVVTVTPDATYAYDDLQIDIDVGSGSDTVELHQVDVEYVPKSSPLSSGIVTIPGGTYDYEPLDLAEFVTDRPLSAWLARRMLDNLRHLRERVQSVPVMWGGAFKDGSDDFPTAASINAAYGYLDPRSLRAPVFVRRGAMRAGRTYTVHAYVEADASVDTHLIISAGSIARRAPEPWPQSPSADRDSVLKLTVTAGTGLQWKTGTLTVPELPPGLSMVGVPHRVADVGMTLRLGMPVQATSTARVRRISVWG